MSRSRDLANLAGDATGLETLTVSDITDLTATATELNYVDGVGSAIQTQINAKIGSSNPTVTLGSNTTWPAGHVVQTKSSFYNSSSITSTTTATTHSQGELASFTPILGTSGKLLVWWWISGVYTTENSNGALIGLRYSTDSFSSETKLGTSSSDWMAGYVGYGQGIRKHTGLSACTGLINTPTASAFSVRFHSKTNSGHVYLNQDVANDTMGIIIHEISP